MIDPVVGASSGSHASTEPASRLGPSGVDPAHGDPTSIPAFGEVSTRPRCGVCAHVMIVDYVADDALWEAALHPSWRNGYVCLNCLASAADEKNIAWDKHIREVRLVSLAHKTSPTPFFHGKWEPVTAAERLRRLHGRSVDEIARTGAA